MEPIDLPQKINPQFISISGNHFVGQSFLNPTIRIVQRDCEDLQRLQKLYFQSVHAFCLCVENRCFHVLRYFSEY